MKAALLSFLLSSALSGLFALILALLSAPFALFQHDLIIKIAVGIAAMAMSFGPWLSLLARLRLLQRQPLGLFDLLFGLGVPFAVPFLFVPVFAQLVTTFTGLQVTRIVPAVVFTAGTVFTFLGALSAFRALASNAKSRNA